MVRAPAEDASSHRAGTDVLVSQESASGGEQPLRRGVQRPRTTQLREALPTVLGDGGRQARLNTGQAGGAKAGRGQEGQTARLQRHVALMRWPLRQLLA